MSNSGSPNVALYKYVSEERFARALIERGEVFMQTLANFRGYEDNDVRRDPNDGSLRYEPAGGLPIQFAGQEPNEPWDGWRFVSSVKDEDVYAYCLSSERSEILAERFESPFCVEIRNPVSLIGRISRRVQLRSQLDRNLLPHGPVDYRGPDAAPAADWALPEKVALMKPDGWGWQNEYRIVIGKKGAFDVENVALTLQTGPQPLAPIVNHAPLILTLGDLSGITELHTF